MPIHDPARIFDAFDTQTGGMNGGVHPIFVAANQSAKLVNCSLRGGIIGTRPGFPSVPLKFESEAARINFERFAIQGGGYYFHTSSGGALIASIGGRVFQITPQDGRVRDLTPDAGNDRTALEAWGCQAEQYFVVQNGVNRAIIIEGTTSRRADPTKTVAVTGGGTKPANEVPIGTAMAFGQGRLVVVTPDRTGFIVGDIAGGATNVLTFSDARYLNEAPAFALSRRFGTIAGLHFVAQADTGAGIGPLLIIGTRGVVAMDITQPRNQWLDLDISRVVLLDAGGVGQRGATGVNGDVFFRSAQGGIRSLRMSRSEAGGWDKTPMSREVAPFMDNDTVRWLKFCQMVSFDNRLLCTVAPQVFDGRYRHGGIVSLDFDLLRSMQGKLPPAWEGLWTGITPTMLEVGQFDGEERCFALCNDADGINRLYEVTRGNTFDLDGHRIESAVETRALAFESPYGFKELYCLDLWLKDIVGETEVVVKWRPDEYPAWTEWHRFTLCKQSPDESGNCQAGCAVLNPSPQSRARIILPRPPKACAQDGSNRELAFGYTFQIRIEWKGCMKIVRARAHAVAPSETFLGECVTEWPCVNVGACPEDDFSYNLAIDEIGCVDAVVVVGEFTPGDFFDLRPWKQSTVIGAAWVLQGITESGKVPYLKGSISGGRMIGLPDNVQVGHSKVELVTFCSDPWKNEEPDLYTYH